MALVEVKVPDIGDFKNVEVIEVLVKPGDHIQAEQSLVTVESDKASMEIPATLAGIVKEVEVKLGDKVSEGSLLLKLEADTAVASVPSASSGAPAPAASAAPSVVPPAVVPAASAPAAPVAIPERSPTASLPPTEPDEIGKLPLASPSIRQQARLLGVPLAEVKGSGRSGRITLEDLQQFVQQVMAGETVTAAQAAKPSAAAEGHAGQGTGLDLLPWPEVDFEKFGAVERKTLSRIKKISGANLHRNWVMIPHVTNNEDADVTELEALRVQLNREADKAKSGVKYTLLAFLIKACVAALRKFPEFNASLDGDALVYKKYYHIGFAADTPNGLVVPVLKDADKKGITEIAQESSELAAKARGGKLGPSEMTGGCFTISSLGGIGGTYFTPIINAPEVAILGVCRSSIRPVWDGKAFEPRLILPMSLSYDHRVIDGASAARFNAFLAAALADFRRVLL